MAFDRRGRMAALRERLAAASLEALLVSKRENVYYLSGFTGDDSFLLVAGDRAVLITDFRYREQAEEELVPGCEVSLRGRSSPVGAAAGLARKRGARRVGFEEDHLSRAAYGRLREELPGRRLVPAGNLIADLRVVKEPGEISRIRDAAAATVRVFSRFRKTVSPGTAEDRQAGRLAAAFHRAGGEPAFRPIVAAGPHSSHPHAFASARKLERGEICLVDLGGRWDFYCADLSRTLAGGSYPRRFKTIYRAVLAAQRAALKVVRPGLAAAELDRAARRVLEEKGLGDHFGHGLGHGVGLEVHERPAVNARSREVLREGMVFTVEPGVYIPGWGGIRIEDTVLVTASGCEILTPAPKTLESSLLEW